MPSKTIYEPEAVLSEATAIARQNTAIQLPVAKEPMTAPEESTSERQNIALLAYSYWQERGCPEGSPEQDWFQAEQAVQLSKLAKQVGLERDPFGSSPNHGEVGVGELLK
jgi:Protein of unknown function (DUF2934)